MNAGLEFGDKADRPAIIVRALYGLKSLEAWWRDHMAATVRDYGFKSPKGDPDVSFKPALKLSGAKYYEYF